MTPSLFPRMLNDVAPGAVHLPGWLDLEHQRHIVGQWQEWARPPAPMRHTRLPRGGVMSVQTVCLGWHWMPYRYSRTVDDGDGATGHAVPLLARGPRPAGRGRRLRAGRRNGVRA